jgi:hypothetical protein
MASKSGMALGADVDASISKFRSRKSAFVVFKINAAGDEFVVDAKGKRRDTVATFLKALPPNEMRLCVLNHEYKTADGRITDKMVRPWSSIV